MYCRDNWIKFSFGGLPKRVKHEVLELEFTQQADTILPLDVAATQTALDIYNRYGDIYVAMSGGCDSEYVAKSFKAAGIPFKAITMTSGYNMFFGEWYVDRWCKENDVELIKFEVPAEELLEYGKQTLIRIRGISWFGVTVNLLANEVKRRGGYMVTGALPSYYPDPSLGIDKAEPGFREQFRGFMFDESDFYIELVNPDYHPWSFFYWSPEMLASLVNVWDTSKTGEDNKADIFGIIPRPKLHGNEMLTCNSIANKIPAYTDQFKWTKAHKQFNWGVRDFAACPDKTEFLKMLVKHD
jgi:hypothetical protein